jgi:ribosome-associated toxin RatA of RatAB toxin-antitoxin module
MRRVELDAVVVATDPATVLENVVRFERYPDLAPHVRSTVVHREPSNSDGTSDWELDFRNGVLRWTERDLLLRDRNRVEFEQVDGDFETFSGHWDLAEDGADCTVAFRCDFDFGIDSLAGILDPIAERVIRETVAWALVGLFDKVRLLGDAELTQHPPGSRPGANSITVR